jgi:hypothetical protein
MNNPTVSAFQSKCLAEFPAVAGVCQKFSLRVWNTPYIYGRPATETISWEETLKRADGWMEVRHCLTHGLASGWRSEVWPGPLRGSTSASSVLRAKPGGKHSIGIIGAITCSRVYIHGGRHVATSVARGLGQHLNWKSIPDFPLKPNGAES